MTTMWGERCWRCSCQDKRKQGRSKRMYLDVVKKDMQEVGARKDEVYDRRIIGTIRCGDP